MIDKYIEEINHLRYELAYHQSLLDYLSDMIPCLDDVVETFEYQGENE